MSPAERAQLLPGKEPSGPHGLLQELGVIPLVFRLVYGGEPQDCCSGVDCLWASAAFALSCPFPVAPIHAACEKPCDVCASAECSSFVLFIREANGQGLNVCVYWLATCEGNSHVARPDPELRKKCFFLFVCFQVKQLCGTCQEEDEAGTMKEDISTLFK